VRILARNRTKPYGTQVPFVANGKCYVGRIERHHNPPGGKRRPWGDHPGVSVFAVERNTPASKTPARKTPARKKPVTPTTKRQPRSTPRSAPPEQPSAHDPRADERLAIVQRAAVAAARTELDRGVREAPRGSNRGERIDLYALSAGMEPGAAWCGFFLEFAYTRAAQRYGRTFAGRRRLHSVGKVRSFFHYRNYTQRSTAARVQAWEALRGRHDHRGASRRTLTLRGSAGNRYATRRGLTHEVYDSYRDLPVRAGDAVLFTRADDGTKTNTARGHLALVESYERTTGVLTTIEGNSANRVRRRTYDLKRRSVRERISSFARPALGDFTR
jgi:hypothetical protein